MSSTAVLNPSLISGSWFPSGYHGHFRSKSRSDLYSDYRQLAKPQPPKAFITRIKERPNSHVFSHHDNRFSFTTDATYLDMGVGKKRRIVTAFTNKPTRDLISWDPRVSGHALNRDLSVYRTAYTAGGVPAKLPLRHPALCRFEAGCTAEDRQTSTYRYTYNPAYNPNKLLLDAMSQECLRARPASIRPPVEGGGPQQARITKPCRSAVIRESVAACLIWDTPRVQRPCTAAPLHTPAAATCPSPAAAGDGETAACSSSEPPSALASSPVVAAP